MLRAILKRKQADMISGAQWERLYTFDFDSPELERELQSGGRGDTGYDLTELVGIEMLHSITEGEGSCQQ
ncbi:MAG: hypothetical protein FJY85_04445 [Deltaproteobacteria bacterium]|nr:hypothetical protein [Deltaproteobacteria bacterium]